MINSHGVSEVKSFIDARYKKEVVFPSNQIDAVIGFFLKKGFDEQAARSTGIVLLTQSRIDNINPMKLLDTLHDLSDVQLTHIVTQVINTTRDKTSALGYKVPTTNETLESRNIKA